MFYFLYGTDTDTARAKAGALTEGLRKKKPDAEVFRLDAFNWNEAKLQELASGQGLFNPSFIVQVVSLFEHAEAKAAFMERLQEIALSPNIFIVLEGIVDKKTLLKVTRFAERVQAFESKVGKKKTEFNIFSLTDALGKRDRRNLWVLFETALGSGAASEEIHGILFWQVKSILLASGAKTASEAGVAPFVFAKAKSFRRNYSIPELQGLSSKLVRIYHDSHRGIHDFEIALERFVLTL
ncbi:MAG: hypothetical protein A2849_02275 [Candidatus Taylorbacteria bacterium RIFCSPHIGHO2_01_FULL_51_15]|uniref:DNA polymerase III delta subunit-like C-terminal domain-containing protein n=1 Tax=Candidatus Taylorbacteria bacterium RIFCSPHIGHO2_01_FULL_51_15 TaxID=1802304 RepID=A0A1G2MB74_9BACT|nr:MAG: hypothetical protein A2849_02275 [Candidatus Taylorbacteria bacterium RIFCSPHIGHO2_01_FULL_51_15]